MRVIIVHGWEGYPEEGWFPWLKKELEAKGVDVVVPQLPDAETPRIEIWVPALATIVGAIDEQTFFVGHSMGCQAIVRLLAEQSEGVQAGGAVFVSGFFRRLTGFEGDGKVEAMDRHWLGTPVDFGKAKSHLKKSIAIFSDDDPWVPLDNQHDFRDQLGSEIQVLHNRGHFSGSRDKTTQLPEVRDALFDFT